MSSKEEMNRVVQRLEGELRSMTAQRDAHIHANELLSQRAQEAERRAAAWQYRCERLRNTWQRRLRLLFGRAVRR